MGDAYHEFGALQETPSSLGNDDIDRNLKFIEDLQNLGVSRYIDMPQLVVVGDQSSGKSSVLQAITKLPFPIDDTMCTRFATEVALIRCSGPESLSVQIRKEDGHTIQIPIQRPNLADTGFQFESQEFGAHFRQLLAHAGQQIPSTRSQPLSKAILQITVRGPQQTNLTIVDIPGLVSVGHEAYDTARALVNQYISNPKSIILAVAHTADPGTQEVFQILRNIQDRESRVVGVINKCDRKQEGADNWILETIKNVSGGENHHYLTQGWFGIRNRLPTESTFSNDERDKAEEEFFSQRVWVELNRPTKLGIRHLKSALVNMHNNHIRRSIPVLVPEIEQQLVICENNLEQLGRSRSTRSEQLDCMMQLASEFSKLANDALDGSYHNLPDAHDTKLRKIVRDELGNFESAMQSAYAAKEVPRFDFRTPSDQATWESDILGGNTLYEIENIIHDNRGREFSDEINPNVMKVLWRHRTTSWMREAQQLIDDLVYQIKLTIDALFLVATPDDDLRINTKQWLSAFLYSSRDAAMVELNKIVLDELSGLWTLVPQFSKKLSTSYEKCVEDMASCLRRLSLNQNVSHSHEHWERQVTLWLASNRQTDTILNTYARLDAYHQVAMARFIDNVGLQVIERHLLGPSSPLQVFTPLFVNKTAEEDQGFLERVAGENEMRAAERRGLNQARTSLREALVMARSYGFS